MKIAIHAADLDHKRIDGTRVYLFNMLKNFGLIDQDDSFEIHHQKAFNARLTPPTFENYQIVEKHFPFLWTQTLFAWNLFWSKADVLWMPVHNIPIFKRRNLKVVVTIHDLAFKIFPEYFTKKDLLKLNRLADMAVTKADRLIAVSLSTKNDILKFYPSILPENIAVIHHGFDTKLFSKKCDEKENLKVLENHQLKAKNYLLYVGAIQPRKNLGVLIDAFEKLKTSHPDLKLVFAGAPAWKHEETFEKIEKSEFKNDIIVTGTVSFDDLPILYQNAKVFVFPSLYEGFGIPVLEAFASGVPVVLADNSSLPEVGGEAAIYFKTEDGNDLLKKLELVLSDDNLRDDHIKRGFDRITEFSWETCAQRTLDNIKK